MSVKMMFEAMNIETGSPITKLVLVKLADNANDQGECWPSHKTIAKVCEMSVKTSQRHIKKLEELGLLTIKKRRNANGSQSNIYQLKFDKQATNSPLPQTTNSPEPSDRKSPSQATESRPNQSLEPISKPVSLQKRRQLVADIYNQVFSSELTEHRLPACKVLTEARQRKIDKLLELTGDIETTKKYFHWVHDNADGHRWIFGENDKGWRADIEYLCRDETYAKAKEGRLRDWDNAA